MLRPATPLTILLFGAFALLLITVISTPVIKGIPLGSYGGIDFGVFGYCNGSKCSNFEIGYNTASLFDAKQTASFDLPASTRTTLSAILVLHPVAAFFCLIMLILAATSHMHSASHSPRYLLGMFILGILTLLCSLLALLIDVLLFAPHMAWGSYLTIAATVLIFIAGIIACIMRRTLVSRKAQKRRIAENAEMNGENFYNRQAALPGAVPTAPVMVHGGPGADNLPAFATFETAKKEGSDRTSDERVPLTALSASNVSPEGTNSEGGIPLQDRYGAPPAMGNGRFNGPPMRDEYGNIIPPPAAPYGAGGRSRDPSQDSQFRNPYPGPGGYRGRGGPPGGYRGRGGPGYPGGRGGYPPGRGGYGAPGRGGPGMMGPMAAAGMAGGAMMRGGRGGPPGYSNGYGSQNGRRVPSPGGTYPPPGGYQDGQYGRRRSNGQGAPGYNNGVSPVGYGQYNNDQGQDSLPRAESPPPLDDHQGHLVGQAVEMDATTGSPTVAPAGFQNQYGIRDSNSDIAGMVGLQQQRNKLAHDTLISDTSRYSADEPYVPPRHNWEQGRASPLSQIPLELPGHETNITSGNSNNSHRRTTSGDHYYEDVDPRFAEPEPQLGPEPTPMMGHERQSSAALPASLTPGFNVNRNPDAYLHPASSNNNLNQSLGEGNNSYEDVQSGSRSPAESDRSNFTSVSQRGVNPRWNPNPAYGNPMPGGSGLGGRRPGPPAAAQRNDMLLASNPDFELPGARGPSRTRGGGAGGRAFSPGGGMVPRDAYSGGNPM